MPRVSLEADPRPVAGNWGGETEQTVHAVAAIPAIPDDAMILILIIYLVPVYDI